MTVAAAIPQQQVDARHRDNAAVQATSWLCLTQGSHSLIWIEATGIAKQHGY